MYSMWISLGIIIHWRKVVFVKAKVTTRQRVLELLKYEKRKQCK
jgi:hypothetical protein